MAKRVTSVRCPYEYARTCEYYKLSIEHRSSESKNRGIALLLATVGLAIVGLDDVNSSGWFITLLMYLASSIGTSFFYSKDFLIKKMCYIILNIYSVALLIICFLGVAGVLVVSGGTISMAGKGVYNGTRIVEADHLFFSLFVIPLIDGFSWIVSAFLDNRIPKQRRVEEG